MSEFLLEIYSEEIPARMQNKALLDFEKIFSEFFAKQNIKVSEKDVKLFISPRRISLLVNKIDEFQILPPTQKIGPKIDANSQAIIGFAKSVGLSDIKDLELIKTEKGEYYAFNSKENKISTKEILENNLPALLAKMANLWPKNMRWLSDKNQPRWVRPIRSILAIFDGKIVDFEFANIKSDKKTFGHNLLSKKSLTIADFDDYKEKLEKNFVNFDQNERKKFIINEIKNICRQKNLKTVDVLDEFNPLLNEAAGLAEFPQVGIGQIDESFMFLPKEVLILTAKLHQKYFCVEDKKGNLAPYFIFVSNVEITEKIILDNQKVLRARLSDAKFFIEEDLKTPFADRVEDLKNIIFHEKLGTIHDKVKRLEVLNKFVDFFIPNANLTLAAQLANLSKNDLTTKCVAELPELQGVVGGYYSKMQNEDDALSQAIAEQYLPLGPNSSIPQTPLGSVLALSDKIDTICGLFLVGQKPTSSKDPLALRRAALGIIRIIIENNIYFPLRMICEKSISTFSVKTLKANYPDKSNRELKEIKEQTLSEVMEFIIERTKSVLKDYFNVRTDLSNVLINDYLHRIKKDKKFDINKLVIKAVFINNFLNDPANNNIIALYKRVVNIVTIEERKDDKTYNSKPHFLTMRDKYERALYKKTKVLVSKIKKLNKAGKYKELFELFGQLEAPLNDFFDNVKVNVEENNVRENRLLILGKIKTLFNSVFDFSKIENS